jgi:hypothetical protein
MSLIDCLSEIKAPRRMQGQGYKSVAILIIIIMSILRGKYGYRETGRFCKMNDCLLITKFGFKNSKVPSYVSIRTFILSTDFASIQQAFHKWALDYVPIESGEWISIDGKSIRSTVSDCNSEYQNFVSPVSLFCSRREQVLHVEKLGNRKGNESTAVEELLEILDLKDVIFTMDALHCKKNAAQNRKRRKSLPGQGKKQSAPTQNGH